MENKIMEKIKSAMDSLDCIANTTGVARATYITILAQDIVDLKMLLRQLLQENAELKAKLGEVPDGEKTVEADEREVP